MSRPAPSPPEPGFRPADISALVHRRVVAEHAGEASFLYHLRERAVVAPHYALKHLARLDARLLAHLRGLQVAADAGWAAARQRLGDDDVGAVFVAAWLAFSGRDDERTTSMVQLCLADARFEPALAAALNWLDEPVRGAVLDALSASGSSSLRRMALSAASHHRCVRPAVVRRALEDADAALRAQALRCIGETKQEGLMPLAVDAMRDADPACRFWAAWSVALSGQPQGARHAFDEAATLPSLSHPALDIAMRCGERQWAMQTVRSLAASDRTRRGALRAAGAFGDPAAVPWLIELMESPDARLAGEAFSAITGADLRYLDLDRDPPAGASADAADDDPDDDLPWPAVAAVRAFWCDAAPRYVPGQRWIGGRPVSSDAAARVLREGFQRQRRGAAVELAAHSRSAVVFSVEARADRQRRWLAS
ncbi:TIGR02270 family protein [Piscinibacter sp. XHJ-5]|uniref:TIGR02270 family protein n=1 Tax=Piscinibacter sp. XHJ-5 TaxID=3037797 RepID=UPI0024529732|nr:TIGR02270 family protein [Piscinibacter sp. XHJ-5]